MPEVVWGPILNVGAVGAMLLLALWSLREERQRSQDAYNFVISFFTQELERRGRQEEAMLRAFDDHIQGSKAARAEERLEHQQILHALERVGQAQ